LSAAKVVAAVRPTRERWTKIFLSPWHKIIRQQIGESDYQKITAGLEMENSSQIAGKQASYENSKGKMSQRGLLD